MDREERERQRRGKGRRLNAAIAIITAVREKEIYNVIFLNFVAAGLGYAMPLQ
jgi:hypothetical protein